jgi:hypothetical protein
MTTILYMFWDGFTGTTLAAGPIVQTTFLITRTGHRMFQV